MLKKLRERTKTKQKKTLSSKTVYTVAICSNFLLILSYLLWNQFPGFYNTMLLFGLLLFIPVLVSAKSLLIAGSLWLFKIFYNIGVMFCIIFFWTWKTICWFGSILYNVRYCDYLISFSKSAEYFLHIVFSSLCSVFLKFQCLLNFLMLPVVQHRQESSPLISKSKETVSKF